MFTSDMLIHTYRLYVHSHLNCLSYLCSLFVCLVFFRSKAVKKALEEAGLKPDPVYQPSLLWPLAKTFGKTVLASAFFKLVSDMLTFVSPIVLKYEHYSEAASSLDTGR